MTRQSSLHLFAENIYASKNLFFFLDLGDAWLVLDIAKWNIEVRHGLNTKFH